MIYQPLLKAAQEDCGIAIKNNNNRKERASLKHFIYYSSSSCCCCIGNTIDKPAYSTFFT